MTTQSLKEPVLTTKGDRENIVIIAPDEAQRVRLASILGKMYDLTICQTTQQIHDKMKRNTFSCAILGSQIDEDIATVVQAVQDASGAVQMPIILMVNTTNYTKLYQDMPGIDEYFTINTPAVVIRKRVAAQAALKQMRDERQATIDNLNTINHVKNHFLRIASHDLKGPVSNIRSALFVLQDYIDGSEESQALTNSIEDILNTMTDTIDRFLDVAMLNSGQLAVEAECLEVGDLLHEAVDQYTMSAAAKNIHINLEERACCIYADATLTRQIIGNLVSNAIKYSPKNSNVTLRVTQRDNMIRISVIDEGSGIVKEEREKLFKQFGQGSNQPTGGESSTGLGLWIAKELIMLQNGNIGVETTTKGGSEFWFELPYCKPKRTQLPVTEPLVSSVV